MNIEYKNKLILNLIKIVEETDINITEEELLNLLRIEKRWPINYLHNQPSVEIISNLGHGKNHFFKIDGYLDFNKWFEFYKLGFTSIISNVLDLNESLRNLKILIEKELGSPINGNFYFSLPGKKASFDLHSHEYDVIVKQIYGDSEWIIGDKKFILKSKKVVYIPLHTEHAVISKDKKKLSLTLNII